MKNGLLLFSRFTTLSFFFLFFVIITPSQVSYGSVNTPPTINTNIGLTVSEGSNEVITNTLLKATDTETLDASSLIFKILTPPTNGIINNGEVSLGTNDTFTQADIDHGIITYSHDGSETISDSFTFTVSDDAGGESDSSAFYIIVTPVNDAPSFTKGPDLMVIEDAGAQTVSNWATGMSAGPGNESSQALSFIVMNDNNTLFAVQPAIRPTGTLTYTPAANANGVATVTVLIKDNGGTANGGQDTGEAQTFTITILPINDAPTFTAGANQTVLEDAGEVIVTGWATGISAGSANENGQELTLTVSTDNDALFAVQPSIDLESGDLKFTTAADANGTATVIVKLKDNGGTANGGQDTTIKTFTITVTGVNDAPTFTKGADQMVNEDAGAQTVVGWATGMSAGPVNESSQTLSVFITNNNNDLFSAQPAIDLAGTLTYTPAANAHGTATVTVKLQDNGGTANGGQDTTTKTFTITMTAINDAPSFTKGANQTVNEDAGSQTVVGWASAISAGPNEPTQTASFEVANNNNALFALQPAIDAVTGTLTYTPAANANGTAIVTVKLVDNGGTDNGGLDTSMEQTFTITVTAVNDGPVSQSGDYTTLIDTAVEEDLLASDVDGDALVYEIVTQPTNGTVVLSTGNGSRFTYTPNSGMLGSDSFEFRAFDGIVYSNTSLVNITVQKSQNADLSSIETSFGSLTPAFSQNRISYTVNVPNNVSSITVTASVHDKFASLQIAGKPTDSGLPSSDIPLAVGNNHVPIIVTAQDGTIKTYTINFVRSQPINNSIEKESTPVNTGTKRQVDVEIGTVGNTTLTEKVDIERIVTPEGKKIGHVVLVKDIVLKLVSVVTDENKGTVRVTVADLHNDSLDEIFIELPKDTVQLLTENQVDLEFRTDYATIIIPRGSFVTSKTNPLNVYLRVAPIREQEKRLEVEDRTTHAAEVKVISNGSNVRVVGTPVTIETNLQNRKVKLLFPIAASSIPDDPSERSEFLNSVAVYIEHSDGEKVVQQGIIKYDANGNPTGIEIEIEKFSTFAIIALERQVMHHTPYIYGYPDGTFRPEHEITRSEMASILGRLMADGQEQSIEANFQQFDDIPSNHWAYGAILRVQSAKLMEGYPDGKFHADAPISRAEMATIVVRWMGLNSGESISLMVDTEGHWAQDVISKVVESELMIGYSDGTFRPDQALTRAEAVTIINQMLKRGPLAGANSPTWSDVLSSHWAYPMIEEASKEHRYIQQDKGELLTN